MAQLEKRQYDSGLDTVFTFKRNSSAGVLNTVTLSSSYAVTATGRYVTSTTNRFEDRSLTVSTSANTATMEWSTDGSDFSSTGTMQVEFELTNGGKTERNPRWFDIFVAPSLSS